MNDMTNAFKKKKKTKLLAAMQKCCQCRRKEDMVGRNEGSTEGTKEGNGNTSSRCALRRVLSTRVNQIMNIKPEGAQHQSIQVRKGLLVEHNEEW